MHTEIAAFCCDSPQCGLVSRTKPQPVDISDCHICPPYVLQALIIACICCHGSVESLSHQALPSNSWTLVPRQKNIMQQTFNRNS